MKPGKLVKKPVQKLAEGSYVNGVWTPKLNKTQQTLNTVGGAAADAGSGLLLAGATNTMNRNVANEYGEIDVKKAGKSGAMTGAAAGLKTGAQIGLNPALLSATGGLSALAVPVAAGIGALVGNRNAKKNAEQDNIANREAFEKQKAEQAAAEEKAKKEAFYNNNFRTGLASAFAQREAGYKDGGKVKIPYNMSLIELKNKKDSVDFANGYDKGQYEKKVRINATQSKTPFDEGYRIRNNEEFDKKNVSKHSNGGKIEGKGTAKSDDIKAKIKKDSFVVPAENAEVAEVIRKKILKAPNPKKKANLNQKQGEDVKLSNGEHLFTPQEVKKIESKGIDIDELAPNAEENYEYEYKDGGGVKSNDFDPSKEKASVEKKKKDLEKAKSEMQSVQDKKSQLYKEKQRIYERLLKQYDDINVNETNYNKSKKEYDALVSSYETFKKQQESAINKPKSKSESLTGSSSRPSEEEFIKKQEDFLNKIESKKKEVNQWSKQLGNSRNESNYIKKSPTKNGQNTSYLKGDKLNADNKSFSAKGSDIESKIGEPEKKPLSKAPPINKKPTTQMPSAESVKFEPNVIQGEDGPSPTMETKPTTLSTEATQTPEQKQLTDSAQIAEKSFVPPSNPSAMDDMTTSLTTGLRGAFEYALPAYQTYLGMKNLQRAGKRPVDKIDPDFLRTIQETKGIAGEANRALGTATAAARYGYTPEELALLNAQNADATAAGRFAARNYSGGSAANAFNMERAALNDSVQRGLMAKVQDTALRLQKQQYADTRRSYADSKQTELNNLIENKADRSRNLFNDTLTAWEENQQAGGELVGAGIQNLIGVNRLQNEREAQKERLMKYGGG